MMLLDLFYACPYYLQDVCYLLLRAIVIDDVHTYNLVPQDCMNSWQC
jgi:hypothetical protein